MNPAQQQLRLKGKKALVLGGTSGIGLATCRSLIVAGADVVAYSRTAEKCERAVEAMSSLLSDDRTFAAHTVDVLDRNALQAAFEAHAETGGGFDYLVNCATGGSRAIGPFMAMDMDGFEGSFSKLWGYANAVRYGAPHVRRGGAIVLVSGSPAKKCKPGYVALSCVGAAVENLVRALAVELSPRGIRVSAVSPGLIDTPMFDGKGDGKAAFLATSTSGNPIPRAGTADEVASAILFALENEFVTGTVIDVDGGAAVPF